MNTKCDKINTKWDIHVHANSNSDWTPSSYKLMTTLISIQDYWSFVSDIPKLRGILFFMKQGIPPYWEAPENKNGGTFVFFFSENNYKDYLIKFTSYLCSELLCNLPQAITGISISPKHQSYSLKVWINDANIAKRIKFNTEIGLLKPSFKKHF